MDPVSASSSGLSGIRPGRWQPPGATTERDGVNFSVFSRDASSVSLLLYRNATDAEPERTIPLDPKVHRTFFFWHVFMEGTGPGVHYAWKVDGSGETANGGRFDSRRPLLDPWSRAVSDRLWDRRKVLRDPSVSNAFRSRVEPDDDYDWEGDEPVGHPDEDSILYELHVGGFTRHPGAGVRNRGTFGALVEKIPYLADLGITDVELMPVMAFDRQDVPPGTAAVGLSNYWGYSPYGFFAVHPGYASTDDARREFRDMVKAFHRAGIGVILDVVLNHTAEGDDEGPSIHFRGLANETFYLLEPDDRSRYRNYTGCGNTLNCNHPLVADFVVRCLEYWVGEMHLDGVRLDLAGAMTRGEDGEPMAHPPVISAIERSPVLRNAKLIAEPWDAHGLYQVGSFPGLRWKEWNGRYRDTIRRAVRGEGDIQSELAARISGSSDLYERRNMRPGNSINYVTCHDGFTLWDLVSYERKHNASNGEDNADGMDDNLSWNCGTEGPTEDPEILGLRRRQARNCVAILLLSQGVPMLHAGDEILRTQRGNNNAWCQDNEIGWFDWSLAGDNPDMLRFVREMIALRKRHRSLRRSRFLTGEPNSGRQSQPDVVWYGQSVQAPDWNEGASGVLRFTLAGQARGEGDLHVMLNLSGERRRVEVPPAPDHRWYRAVDTSLTSPRDILPPDDQPPIGERLLAMESRSAMVLESR